MTIATPSVSFQLGFQSRGLTCHLHTTPSAHLRIPSLGSESTLHITPKPTAVNRVRVYPPHLRRYKPERNIGNNSFQTLDHSLWETAATERQDSNARSPTTSRGPSPRPL